MKTSKSMDNKDISNYILIAADQAALPKPQNRQFLQHALLICAMITMALMLQACAGGSTQSVSQPWKDGQGPSAQQGPNALDGEGQAEALNGNAPPTRVAILLPLSGKHAETGEAMLQAAQMALFDLGNSNFELMPVDTRGTRAGGESAAKEALNDGAQLIIGPLFADSVRGAQTVVNRSPVNMIAFSTDWSLANGKTYLIGFLPFDQVNRVVSFASDNRIERIGVLSPDDEYGNAVIAAYEQAARDNGILSSRVERFKARSADLSLTIREFSDFDKRNASTEDLGPPFDAVLIPAGGGLARSIGNYLSHYKLSASEVRRLGTGLMDDPRLAKEVALNGTWFAAPNPQSRAEFERRFRRYYYNRPPRIASLAYDATALAAILSRMGIEKTGQPDFSRSALTNPNGFAGIDGIFRFRSDSIAERGLAILEFRNGRVFVIDPAPKTFQSKPRTATSKQTN